MTKKESDGVLHQMSWHPQSPDLKRIEMVCNELDHRVNEKQPTSAQNTVEVGSLHTLRLESIKFVFNHSTHFFLTTIVLASQLGHLLCVMFPIIVYRQIISLIIHCITIPVGQKFTYTKLTVPLTFW